MIFLSLFLFVSHRQEIQYPSMRALAQHLGTEREYEALLVDGQPLSPPAGATEVELKTWEVCYENHYIVQITGWCVQVYFYDD